MKILPNWLCNHLTDQDLTSIRESIARAEKKTSGEIVAMVVHRSTTFGHVQPLLFALVALVLTLIGEEVSWLMGWPPYMTALGSIVIAFALASGLDHLDFVRRLMTSKEDMALSVFRRAQLEFHETGIPATAGRTGVLIMISMVEHRAVILGDHAISEKLNQEVWVKSISAMLAKIKAGDFKGGLAGAVD
ncbi:MAG: TPM domain-containing protein, partial [Bdellovibrionota bacterium]